FWHGRRRPRSSWSATTDSTPPTKSSTITRAFGPASPTQAASSIAKRLLGRQFSRLDGSGGPFQRPARPPNVPSIARDYQLSGFLLILNLMAHQQRFTLQKNIHMLSQRPKVQKCTLGVHWAQTDPFLQ